MAQHIDSTVYSRCCSGTMSRCRLPLLVVAFIFVACISTSTPYHPSTRMFFTDEELRKLPRCGLRLIQKSMQSSLFKDPKMGLLKHYVAFYNVTLNATTGSRLCEIPIEQVHADFSRTGLHYSSFFCTGSSPRFTNTKNIRSNLFASIAFQNCEISLLNLATYGRAVDLKVVSLIEGTIVEDLAQPFMVGDELAPIAGLDNITAFTISARKDESIPIPSLLFTHKWPQIAEILLINVSATQSQIDSFSRSMPNLQSLELIESSGLCVPSEFPWAVRHQALPRNMSRSIMFNNQYAGVYGLDIDPHIFRRRLILEHGGITNLLNILLNGNLDMISLAMNRIEGLAEDTFSKVTGLQNLKLNNNNLTQLPRRIFASLTSLKRLDLSKNRISSLLNGLFDGLPNLTILKISSNLLQSTPEHIFSHLYQLTLLDLSENRIESFENSASNFETSNSIREINLNGNKLANFPVWIFLTRSLKGVGLSRNLLSFEILKRDLDNMVASEIAFLNRESASSLTNPFKPLYNKVIDLSYNNFTTLNLANFSREKMITFIVILSFFKLNLDGNDIRCDCDSYKMHEFLDANRRAMEDTKYTRIQIDPYYYRAWKCSGPVSVQNMPIVDVQNRTFTCKATSERCPEQCTCSRRSYDNSIIVNCSALGLTRLPTFVPNGTDTLLFRDNSLRTIGDFIYLRSLRHLDVSRNKIYAVEDAAVTAFDNLITVDLRENRLKRFPVLFEKLKRVNLMLGNNRFVCDCHERWAVRWIFDYRMKISDINEVKCASGRAQSEIIYKAKLDAFTCEVSKETIVAITSTVCIVMLLIILAMLLGYTFRGEVKVLLYFHFKWHPFDRTDGTDVVDKLYDAFVSYNQADADYVLENLQPGVETPEFPYRLCIHERDFRPGGGITENVLYSVKYSRRMIMVLTKNYLKSEWCRLEFKSAHRRVLKDRSNYLIVIMFDGLDVDDLDEDMKLYLKTNTYIKHDCKWFWKQLFYALPQKPLSMLRKEAYPKGGYDTLFPSPDSVVCMQSELELKGYSRSVMLDSKLLNGVNDNPTKLIFKTPL